MTTIFIILLDNRIPPSQHHYHFSLHLRRVSREFCSLGLTFLHVRKNGSTSKQGSGTNGTSLDGSGKSGRAAAGLGVAGRVLTNGTSVSGEARGDGVVGGSQGSVAGSGGWDVGGVRDVAAGGGARVGNERLVVRLGAVGGGVVGGGKNAIEDVQDTVGDQDIGGDDTSAVDEDLAVNDGDGNVATAESGDGAVGQRAAVCDGAVDDVVLQD